MFVIYSVISILTTILLYSSRPFKNTFSYPEYIRYAYLLPNHKNQFAFCCLIILGCLKWWVLKHKFMSKKIKFISIKSGCPWVHFKLFSLCSRYMSYTKLYLHYNHHSSHTASPKRTYTARHFTLLAQQFFRNNIKCLKTLFLPRQNFRWILDTCRSLRANSDLSIACNKYDGSFQHWACIYW